VNDALNYLVACVAWPWVVEFHEIFFPDPGKFLKTRLVLENFGICCLNVLKVLWFQLFKIIVIAMWKIFHMLPETS